MRYRRLAAPNTTANIGGTIDTEGLELAGLDRDGIVGIGLSTVLL
jgi:hypothetical protein